ncbi:hypothetical protein [Bifidobacterium cuniculi]|uniref:Uncharacterized protein n=1 Tax=Bifidobacterium cuniculi TaxID=1688 RepID=A0A087B4F2_9BIFI|nr:hypothetical protein [Bifidobacterium cuniculi]KFI65902.1 hypothetical protein BCUN_0400 [Bifidobacterium cuniculi]
MFRRSKDPLRHFVNSRVVIASAGHTWRGLLTGSDGTWILLESVEYVNEFGVTSPADGQLLLRADRVEYLQIIPHRFSEVV